METLSSIPKWFWIAIAVIIGITLLSTFKCKSDIQNATANSSTDNSSTQAPSALDMIPGMSHLTS